MDEKRYSLRTVGKLLDISAMAIKYRACALGIDTSSGLTAANVKAIKEFKRNSKYAKRNSLDDLLRELEAEHG